VLLTPAIFNPTAKLNTSFPAVMIDLDQPATLLKLKLVVSF
jgi:hypothetical protein